MNNRQRKIEALNIAYGLCDRVDIGMFEDNCKLSEEDQIKIIEQIHEIGFKLYLRAKRLQARYQPYPPGARYGLIKRSNVKRTD